MRRSVPTAPPPCSAEPDRWFDRAHRTHALATCLECPARQWCAQEALRTRARWGMWAGIWIDGTPTDVSDRLHAIVDDTKVMQVVENRTPPTKYDGPRPALPFRSAPTRRPGSVTAAVLARSSGHCEIVSDDCRFTADVHLSRLPGGTAGTAASAAALYAACNRCAQAFGTAASAEARRLGYLVDSPAQLDRVPFYWRHARWVLFGRWGQLQETSVVEQTAHAS